MSIPHPSSLRTASNIIAAVLVGAVVALGVDYACLAFDVRPYVSCEIMPLWESIAAPWAGALMIAGAALWVVSRRTRGAGLMILVTGGLIAGISWGWPRVLDPVCI